MIVSGLLVTLGTGASLVTLLDAMRARLELTAGQVNDRWLPVALEARDDQHSREVHDWLMALPGVEYVDVTSVNFEADDDAQPAPLPSREPRPPQRRPIPALALND